jgi:hypothetical protein
MEDEFGGGTARTHLERRLFNNDIMTGSSIFGDVSFSIFNYVLL